VIILAFVLAPRRLRFLATPPSRSRPVVMLTWIAMPNLTRLLDAWLYAGTDARH
jgi:antibiotic biosynthesis monooxygenase (ABM) superfamily enzyme